MAGARTPLPGDLSLKDFGEHFRSSIETYNRDAKAIPNITGPGLEQCYRIADALALKFRRFTDAAFFTIFLSVFLAAVFFAVFAHAKDHPLSSLFAYAGLLAAASGVYLWARRANLPNKAQDYRALAEGLRVACAWRVLGIADPVSSYYLLRQPDEARWIRYALAAFERIESGQSPARPSEPQGAIADTIRHWIRPEWEYYVSAWRSVQTRLQWCERIARAAVFISVALALSLFLAKIWPNIAIGHFAETHFEIILILSTIFAVAAALAHNFIEKRAWREHARRYSRMGRLLEDTVQRLDPLPGRQAPVAGDGLCLLRAVAQEELDENSEWLQIHRDRPFEFPHLG